MRTDTTLFRRPCRESGETYAGVSSLWLDKDVSSQRAEGLGTTDVPPHFPRVGRVGKNFPRSPEVSHQATADKFFSTSSCSVIDVATV